MNARQKAANPFQHFAIVQLGRAAPASGAHAKGKAAKMVQGGVTQDHRANRRNLRRHQLGGEVVLFLNLCIGPALGPVKLGDDGASVFKLHLVDAVFVRRQGGQPPVAAQAHAVQGVQHQVGGQRFKGVVHGGYCRACRRREA